MIIKDYNIIIEKCQVNKVIEVYNFMFKFLNDNKLKRSDFKDLNDICKYFKVMKYEELSSYFSIDKFDLKWL